MLQFLGVEIIPKPEIYGRTKLSVFRPIREFDGTDQLGPDPCRRAEHLWRFLKRRTGDDERLQSPVQNFECLLVKPGAHIADPDQFAAFAHPQNKGAEILALTLRESADEELVATRQFKLQPFTASPRFVTTVGPLGEYAFQAWFPGGIENLFSRAGKTFGKAEDGRR